MHRLRNFAALLAPNDGPVPGGVPPPSGGIGTPPAPAPAPAPVPVPVLAPAPAPTPPDDRLIKLEAENAALRKENERLKPAPVRPTKDGEVPADVLDRIAKLEASNSAQAMELALEKAGIKDPKQRLWIQWASSAFWYDQKNAAGKVILPGASTSDTTAAALRIMEGLLRDPKACASDHRTTYVPWLRAHDPAVIPLAARMLADRIDPLPKATETVVVASAAGVILHLNADASPRAALQADGLQIHLGDGNGNGHGPGDGAPGE